MPTLLRITDWNEHFENNRTRDLKVMSWLPVPVKLGGDGYTEILDHPNGAAHFGAWIAILQVAAGCDERGTLLRGNRSGVRAPHDAQSLARMTRIPIEIIEEALPRLIAAGWVTAEELPASRTGTASSCGIPALLCEIPAPSRARADRTGHNRGVQDKRVQREILPPSPHPTTRAHCEPDANVTPADPGIPSPEPLALSLPSGDRKEGANGGALDPAASLAAMARSAEELAKWKPPRDLPGQEELYELAEKLYAGHPQRTRGSVADVQRELLMLLRKGLIWPDLAEPPCSCGCGRPESIAEGLPLPHRPGLGFAALKDRCAAWWAVYEAGESPAHNLARTLLAGLQFLNDPGQPGTGKGRRVRRRGEDDDFPRYQYPDREPDPEAEPPPEPSPPGRETPAERAWVEAREKLKRKLDPEEFATWFLPLQPIPGERPAVWCPNSRFSCTISESFGELLREAVGGEVRLTHG